MGTARTALLLSLLFVFLPLSIIPAEEPQSLEVSCNSNVVNAGQEVECTLDLSAVQGVSTLRFEFVLESQTSSSDSSVLSVGHHHTCSILENGTAICWGHDGYEQLGDGGDSSRHTRPSTPVSPPSDEKFDSIYSNHHRTCALSTGKNLFCWGQNDHGETGDGTSNVYSSPTNAVGFPVNRTVVDVGMGDYHTCAILDDRSLNCWGHDGDGKLGNGADETSVQYSPVSVSIPEERNPIDVEAGKTHTCVLFDDGGIMCWGRDHVGQNGDAGSGATTHLPGSNVVLPAGRSAIDLSVGAFHACAILDNSSIACWGWNAYGQIGDNTTIDAISPVLVKLPIGAKATDVDAGYYHTCAALENGSVSCWGRNNWGQISDLGLSYMPRHVNGTESTVNVAASEMHTCALADNGTISCWGENGNGQLGIGSTSDKYQPHQLDWSAAPFASISGSAPIGEWEDHSAMRGRLNSNNGGIWNVSFSVPESTVLGPYSLKISMLKIGGIRSSINLDNVVQIIGVDTDRDGVVDAEDSFPSDPDENSDRDGDGVGDNSDVFPDDPTETLDGDGDGVGDNTDAFPIDPTEWKDSDSDGVGDEADFYPYDASKSNSPSTWMILAPVGALLSLLFLVMFIRVWTRNPSDGEAPTRKFRGRRNPDRKF
ncbi:MAG TPA: hypothetical protein HA345_01985 [Candidatus Thalassarchaeaceae archaeon]|nr:MAG TPA: hypothetical protein D7H94_01980 [Candidatus Poseidoniales archaeon]HIH84159.1 hypothetical protein [Candidatus Thalassarchaeaceae archaeon]